MFTGIVEGTGAIADIQERAEGIRLVVSARLPGRVPAVGASVALNGCCLTLVKSARKGAGASRTGSAEASRSEFTGDRWGGRVARGRRTACAGVLARLA